jgi:2-oxoisovalerate dehydrogenase E2 component (dihydrolipoyl transacylase)
MAIPPEENGFGGQQQAAAAAHVTVDRALPPARARNQGDRGEESRPERSRFYSPAVMRLAEERGIDLSTIQGTGIGGRVTRKDVEMAPLRPAPAPAAAHVGESVQVAAKGEAGSDYEVVTFSPTRRSIAEHLVRSNVEAPQAWMMVEVDVTGLVRLREREKERFLAQEGVALTLLPYFAAAACEALREFPMLNARWEADELRRYRAIHLGIAVAAESGLVVPVVHAAGDLSVAGLARRIADVAERARARKLRVDDVEGGTFTVNNTGAFGSIASKPIVNHPQVGIVTMERAVKRVVARDDDGIAVRWMMNACLSFDHRALDGLEAGGFMASLKRRLEAIS